MYAEKGGWVPLGENAIIPKVPGTIKVGVSERLNILVGTWYPKWWVFAPKFEFLLVPGTLKGRFLVSKCLRNTHVLTFQHQNGACCMLTTHNESYVRL